MGSPRALRTRAHVLPNPQFNFENWPSNATCSSAGCQATMSPARQHFLLSRTGVAQAEGCRI
jgi:hypothetical protein